MSESGSISSSEPLAHSDDSDVGRGSSSLYLSSQKSRKGYEKEKPRHHHKRRARQDDDGECSSSASIATSVRKSLRKRRTKLESASTEDDQELVDYQELKKEEADNASPLFPNSARKRSVSLPKKNSMLKNKVTNNNVTSDDNLKNDNKNVSKEAKETKNHKQSKCCLLI